MSLRIGRALACHIHDEISEIVRSGLQHNVFEHTIPLRDGEQVRFAEPEDAWAWLEATGRGSDEEQVLAKSVTRALLIDSCQFIRSAIDCATAESTTVAFALLRKPFAENLFLLEQLLLQPAKFCANLKSDPLTLRLKTLSSPEARLHHVQAVLAEIGPVGGCFDAGFLAELRFEKASPDSFEPLWNKALHIITEHQALKTEKMNLNFVFSDRASVRSHQSFFFARVPYVLAYFREVAEALVGRFALTPGSYLDTVYARFAAGVVLWARNLDVVYQRPSILSFANAWAHRLLDAGETSRPSDDRLADLFAGGARPGDSASSGAK